MKMLTLPVALSLVTGLAFAAPPAKTGSPNAKGVARSTAVRNEEATENANGPRLVTRASGRNVRRTGLHATRMSSVRMSSRSTVRTQTKTKY